MNMSQISPEVKDLVTKLESPNGLMRQEARTVLVGMGPPAVPALVEALLQSTHWGRWEAAKALSEIQAPLSAPALVAALEDDNCGVRWLAAEGLVGTGRAALRPLLESLIQRADSVLLREGAHHVLHNMKEHGLLREPELKVYHALRDRAPDIEVPWVAEEALKELAE